jgi:putative intracellular protease/amidase
MNRFAFIPVVALGLMLGPSSGMANAVRAQAPPAPAAEAPPAGVKLPPVPVHKRLRLAVYKGPGAAPASRATLVTALGRNPNLLLHDISADDIRAGKLDGYDVVVLAGGSGGGEGRALGPDGRTKIKEFVQRGGAYLGVCAGAYLATCDYPWSLNILNARVLDKAHWARGRGLVSVAPTDKGRDLLGLPVPLDIQYGQGPLLAPGDDKTLPAYEELAVYKGEVALNGAPHGVMPGTTAVAAAVYGSGRVVCFSPHPEKINGQEPLLHRAVLWATRTPATTPAASSETVVRP